MFISARLNKLLQSAKEGELCLQLKDHNRYNIITDKNQEFIPDWRDKMKILDEEIKKINIEQQKIIVRILKKTSIGVYECFVNWIEKSGIFEVNC